MNKILTFLILFVPFTLFSQQQVVEDRPPKKSKIVSLGAKVGSPIGGGFSLEFILPFAQSRIALYGDYSELNNIIVDETSINHEFSEFGLQIYLGKGGGRGLYLGGGLLNTSTDLRYADQVSSNGNTFDGEATTSLELELINAKLGFKTGGLFYFRVEVGYGFGDIPQELEITGTTTVNGMQMQETAIEEIPEIPGVSENGMFTTTLGVGLSF